jgi:hypothetical protein
VPNKPVNKYLRLNFATLQKEMEVVPAVARDFLSAEGTLRLEKAKGWLNSFKSRPGEPFTWEIPRSEPITTRPSDGEYEGKKSQKTQKGPIVIGALSFKWHLKTGPKPVRDVFLVDNATTQLRLYKDAVLPANELSMWRMEIGMHDSPGCFFHAQVLGTDEQPPFPKALPVPRLPIFPPTPMTCLEYLLSELFQIGWQQHLEKSSSPLNLWRGIQRDRLSSFLKWQLGQITHSTGSPLVHLKAFPGADVLMVP